MQLVCGFVVGAVVSDGVTETSQATDGVKTSPSNYTSLTPAATL